MFKNLEYGVHEYNGVPVVVDGLNIRDEEGNVYSNHLLNVSGGALATKLDQDTEGDFWTHMEKAGSAFKRTPSKKVVVLFREIACGLTEEELEAVINHELCHIDNHVEMYDPTDPEIAERCEIEADAAGAAATSPQTMWSALTKITKLAGQEIIKSYGGCEEDFDECYEIAMNHPQMLARKNALSV